MAQGNAEWWEGNQGSPNTGRARGQVGWGRYAGRVGSRHWAGRVAGKAGVVGIKWWQ